MSQTGALIADHLEEWGFVPFVVRDVFGGAAPEEIAATLNDFCVRSLRPDIERSELFHASVGCVHGVRLRDGRRAVVKVHRPETSIDFLASMQAVQRTLVAGLAPGSRPSLILAGHARPRLPAGGPQLPAPRGLRPGGGGGSHPRP